MRFAALCLASVASATIMEEPTRVFIEKRVIEQRDLQTIQGVLSSVSSSLSALNAAATAFSGDLGPLQNAANALSDTITSGTTTVQGTSNISVNDAVTLQSQATALQTEGQDLVNSLAAKKSAIEQAGACQQVLQQSDTLNTNSKALISAVVGKVPTEVQSIAQQIVGGFSNTLAQNSANFAASNCTNASGSGGGGSTASSSASASSASSASSATGSSGATGSGAGSNPTATASGGAAGTTGLGPGGAPTSTVVTAGVAATAMPLGMGLVAAALML